jgi:hypothetical protein
MPPTTDRRSFLQQAALGAAAITIGPTVLPLAGLLPAAGAQQRDDEALAAFAESLELTLVEAYEAGEPLLSEDLAAVAQTFASHHREHAATFAELAGDQAGGEANPVMLEALTPLLEELDGQTSTLSLLRDLENQVVITYAWAMTTLEAASVIEGVATILPVESAHATALAEALGEGPQAWFPSGAFEADDLAFGIDPAFHPIR